MKPALEQFLLYFVLAATVVIGVAAGTGIFKILFWVGSWTAYYFDRLLPATPF